MIHAACDCAETVLPILEAAAGAAPREALEIARRCALGETSAQAARGAADGIDIGRWNVGGFGATDAAIAVYSAVVAAAEPALPDPPQFRLADHASAAADHVANAAYHEALREADPERVRASHELCWQRHRAAQLRCAEIVRARIPAFPKGPSPS